jgi:hypothetical protein
MWESQTLDQRIDLSAEKCLLISLTTRRDLMLMAFIQHQMLQGSQGQFCNAVYNVFGEEFIDAFLMVNDLKSRMDDETATAYQGFWICAALALTACTGSLGVSTRDGMI